MSPMRPMIVCRRGAVSAGDPQAAAAGLRVLMEGGNAVDAAVTAAAVLAVVHPQACGIGGGWLHAHRWGGGSDGDQRLRTRPYGRRKIVVCGRNP